MSFWDSDFERYPSSIYDEWLAMCDSRSFGLDYESEYGDHGGYPTSEEIYWDGTETRPAEEPSFSLKENTHKPSHTWQKVSSKKGMKKLDEIFYSRPTTKNGVGYSLFDDMLSAIDKHAMFDRIPKAYSEMSKCSVSLLSVKPTVSFFDAVDLLKTYGKLVSKKYYSSDNVVAYKYSVPLTDEFGDGVMYYWFNTAAPSRLKNQTNTIQKLSRKDCRHSRQNGNCGKTKHSTLVDVY